MANVTHTLSRAPLRAGGTLGVLLLPAHLFLASNLSHQLAAITLVLIAGVYLGYAFQDGRLRIIVIEAIGAVVFAAAAGLGINGHPMAIPIALAAHGGWDLLHHRLIETEMPRWYIPFCALVDWVVAAGLVAIWTLAG